VELQGVEVGEVRQAQLRYEPGKPGLLTRVVFSIDPGKVQVEGLSTSGTSGTQAVSAALAHLVARGLRAQVTEASLITGSKVIALSVVEEAPPGRLTRSGGLVQIPTAPSGDLTDLLARSHQLVTHLERATAGPELKSSLRSLDHTLAQLDTLTRTAGPDLAALIAGLRRTADAANGTLTKVQGLVGGDVPADSDLPQLILEVTRAARSVRELADYLERHPEALLRGRGKDGS
jgi:paraquat-inducible protein B